MAGIEQDPIDFLAKQRGVSREEVLGNIVQRIKERRERERGLVVNTEGKFRVLGFIPDLEDIWVAGEFSTREEASEFAVWGTFYPNLPSSIKIDAESERAGAKAFLHAGEFKNTLDIPIMYKAFTPGGKEIPWFQKLT